MHGRVNTNKYEFILFRPSVKIAKYYLLRNNINCLNLKKMLLEIRQ